MLAGLSPVYGFVVNRKNSKFNTNRQHATAVGVPVISIGNLTTGGTGKTPFSIWVTQRLQEMGARPAIISRGYGASKKDKQTNEIKNDEALEIEARIPGIVQLQHPDRIAVANRAIQEFSVDAIVLDDGFQHRRLARDLDLVLIDATCPFGFDHLLPRGLLREPMSSIARASAVVITRAELVAQDDIQNIKTRIRSFAPEIPIATVETLPEGWLSSAHAENQPVDESASNEGQSHFGPENDVCQMDSHPLSHLANKRLYSFCAIGNPLAFQKTLGEIGNTVPFSVVGHRSFPDHHHFSESDLDQLIDVATTSLAQAMVCTHKDWVKIEKPKLGSIPLHALTIGISFRDGEDEIQRLLESCFNLKKS